MHRFAPLVFALLLAASASAQTPGDSPGALRRIVLVDGTVFVGTVADESADPVVILSTDGLERRVPRARVAEITDLIAGRFRRLDPTRSRLILTPTARTIGAGNARLSLLAYIVPNVAYGLTDRIDLSATGFLTFGSGSGVLPVLGFKGTVVDTPGLQAAVGASAVIPLGDDVGGGFAVTPYGVVTVGSEVRSLTFAVGGAFGGDLDSGDLEFADGFVVSAGGEVQVSNSVKLLAEAIVPLSGGEAAFLVLPGVRFFGDRFSIDVYGALGGVREERTTFNPQTGQVTSTGSEFQTVGFAPFLNASYRF